MTTYDPTVVDRLLKDAREDDARLPRAPWQWDDDRHRLEGDFEEPPDPEIDDPGIRTQIIETDGGNYPPAPDVGKAIARVRNNLHALADQLEAACDVIKKHEQAADEDWKALNQIKADREEWRKAYHDANAEADRLQRELAQARHR